MEKEDALLQLSPKDQHNAGESVTIYNAMYGHLFPFRLVFPLFSFLTSQSNWHFNILGLFQALNHLVFFSRALGFYYNPRTAAASVKNCFAVSCYERAIIVLEYQ